VRVEVDAREVDAAFASVAKDIQKRANLPGFRPGKAPLQMVLQRFEEAIKDETKRKLINDSYKQAIDEQKLDVVGAPDVEEIQFGRGQALQFAATVETAPDFELPEYKGIPVKRDARTVTDEDVERAMEALRQPRATFNTVDRPAQTGDFVVVNYTGACEGKPITEIAPAAMGLTKKEKFWIELGSDSFIPGFGEQLLGAKAGDKRTVTVNFPPDFVTPQLAGKQGVYEVDVTEVKQKELPALDDAFAKNYGAEDLGKLREGVRRDLDNELRHKNERSIRNQLIGSLLNRVNFELPESSVAEATRDVVYDIVQENSKRGVSRETIEKEKDKIYSAATHSARERLKAQFLLRKIAEKEDVKVAQEEIVHRISVMASMYQIPAKKFLKDLQQRNGLIEIYDQIMNEKVLALLEQNAKVEDVLPGSQPNPG
jgi:trigger factor